MTPLLDVQHVKKIKTRFQGSQVESVERHPTLVQSAAEDGNVSQDLVNPPAQHSKYAVTRDVFSMNRHANIMNSCHPASGSVELGFVFVNFNLLDTLSVKDTPYLWSFSLVILLRGMMQKAGYDSTS